MKFLSVINILFNNTASQRLLQVSGRPVSLRLVWSQWWLCWPLSDSQPMTSPSSLQLIGSCEWPFVESWFDLVWEEITVQKYTYWSILQNKNEKWLRLAHYLPSYLGLPSFFFHYQPRWHTLMCSHETCSILFPWISCNSIGFNIET